MAVNLPSFMISYLDYSNSLPTGVPLEKEKRACTSMQPWDFKHAEPGPSTTPLGDFGSGCQLGLGLIVRGPSDVFLKHCVNPNEFWVPCCPSPILFNCKNVVFSLAQNYYYKSLCLRASQAVVEYIFFLGRFRISDLSLNLGQD